jgi:Kef-type K+ transport system membrane component KefB
MDTLFSDIAVVVVASGLLAWLALLTRQPIIVAYIAAGMLLGPTGLRWVHNVAFIDGISHIGISLLLFLAGVVLHPTRMMSLFRQTMIITVATGALFALITMLFAVAMGFNTSEALIMGLALMFSSTILAVKLLPTTTLHQRHMGALSIAILIAQDLLAVVLLMFLNVNMTQSALRLALTPLVGAVFIVAVLAAEQFVVRRIMRQVECYQELLFLTALAWCFGVAMAANALGFSHEVGAFVAGFSLARSPISRFLTEGLKFMRDFFLVLFFFALGARIDLGVVSSVLLPAALLSLLIVVVKPLSFTVLSRLFGEEARFSREVGIRLGQASEFSLIVALVACQSGILSMRASQLVQVVTIITMIISSYITVFFYPTPLGSRNRLKQD